MADTFSDILADADDAILDGLGETVTITGKGTVVGVFEDEYDDDVDVQGSHPMFTYDTSDLTVVSGDELVRSNGSAYTVRVPESDGTGLTALILQED